MLIGAHISVAKGYLHALEYAQEVGAECMQFFAKSPRQWQGPALDPHKVAEFVAAREAAGFGPVFTHTAYLINLGTDDPHLRERSVAALADELVRSAMLGATGVVTHLGNDPLGDSDAAARRIARGIGEAFEVAGSAGAGARLLLENTAGAGRTFGSTVDQLAAVIAASGLPSERLGVCFDTCHGFASGMALETPEGWGILVRELSASCGVERLGLIHANDCMFERGSKRDRHAWIGDGFIGVAGFSAMVCKPELAAAPVCMEMPGDIPAKDSTNIARLKGLREACEA